VKRRAHRNDAGEAEPCLCSISQREHVSPRTIALVGLLLSNRLDDRAIAAIRQGLKDAGYSEGRNLAIKYRSADGRQPRRPKVRRTTCDVWTRIGARAGAKRV
jgi:hypothetical protein